jgi:hypothetical protein
MSSLIQHSVTIVERENVYGGCQWHATVIQGVSLKTRHISRLHFEQKIVRKKPDCQPLYRYEDFNVSRYCAKLYYCSESWSLLIALGDNEITRTESKVLLLRAELCIWKGGSIVAK